MSNWLQRTKIDFNAESLGPPPENDPHINDIFSVVELLNHQLDKAGITPTRFEAAYKAQNGKQLVAIKAANEEDEIIAATIVIDEQGLFDISFPHLRDDMLSETGASYGLLIDVLEDGLFGSLPEAERHLFEETPESAEDHDAAPTFAQVLVAA